MIRSKGMHEFVLGDPRHFTVSYAINELTDPSAFVDRVKAGAQFERVAAKLGDVAIVPGVAGYPDFVFLSNSALLVGSIAILARYRHSERRGEEEALSAWLAGHGYTIIRLPEEEGLVFEGQGDCRWSHGGRHLWMGYGSGRTTLRGIEAVKKVLKDLGLGIEVHPLHIRDRRTYHLDLCLCPLPNGKVLWHASSFLPAGRATIERVFGSSALVNVPMKYIYGCNSVVLDSRTLLVPKLAAEGYRAWLLGATGLRILEVNVGEFQKAGGSISCMVLITRPPAWL